MRILWLKTELLHPLDKGGKIRTYNMLRELKRDHQITYLTLNDGAVGDDGRKQALEYCDELVWVPHQSREKFTAGFYAELLSNLISPLPYAIKKYNSPLMRKEIRERAKAGTFDLVVCDFLAPAGNLLFDLGCEGVPAVLFQHNVEAMIWKRHAEVQTNPIKKSYLYAQWLKMRAFERKMCRCLIRGITFSVKYLIASSFGNQSIEPVKTMLCGEGF